MIKNVKIVTHTGCDISMAEAEDLSVIMIPDLILSGGVTYKNMVDISPENFYDKLIVAEELPTSSHPPIGEYISAFRLAGETSDEILCLMITSKMSGCYQAALTAKSILENDGFNKKIHIYDTAQCSHGMGYMVREAAAMADDGLSATEIVERLEMLKERIGVYFILDSLKFAKKGGRVGAIKSLAVDILGLKPLLVFRDGLVSDIAINKNFAEGMESLVSILTEEGDMLSDIIIFHGNAMEKAEKLKELILDRFPDAKLRVEMVGSVIGLYAGPGTCGIAFKKKC